MSKTAFAAIVVLVLGFGSAARAEEAGGKLTVELNRAQTVRAGCRISLVVRNELGGPVESARLELVFFDIKELVDTVTALELGPIRAGKTQVVQFDLTDRKCEDFSRLLVNRPLACKGAGLADATCLERLALSNRTKIAFGM